MGDDPDPHRTSWIGRATPPPPVDPWARADTELYYVPQPQYVPTVPIRRRRRGGLGFLLVVLVVFGLCCVGGGLLAWSLSGGKGFGEGSSAIGEAPPGLNAAVRDGKLEFVVSAVSCGHATVGGSIIHKTAQGQYCIVELSVANISTKSQTFADNFQELVGSDGVEYGADTTAGVIANESGTAVWNSINPGNKITGKMVFDIPKGAEVAKVVLHDSPFSTGATITL
jgi:hypothetical protein